MDPTKHSSSCKLFYKSERSAKAAVTRIVNKAQRKLEIHEIYKSFGDISSSDAREKLLAEYEVTQREAYNAYREPEMIDADDYAIAEYTDFKENIEKTRTTRNILNPNGKEFEIPVNTPNSCDPGSETYHCM
jgi:hypothetical protein